jgi:hypothetical protein
VARSNRQSSREGREILLFDFHFAELPDEDHRERCDDHENRRSAGDAGHNAGDVYRVAFPRTDLHVIADGITIKPGLARGSWATFAGTDERASVMGDLVLIS